MTEREPGWYWVHLLRIDGTFAVTEVAEWDGEAWHTCGTWERWEEELVCVLSGPLQPPSSACVQPWDGKSMGYDELFAVVDSLRDGSTPSFPECVPQEVTTDNRLRMDEFVVEFEAQAKRADGTTDYEASRPVKADGSGCAGPMVSGEANRAVAYLFTLPGEPQWRYEARALATSAFKSWLAEYDLLEHRE